MVILLPLHVSFFIDHTAIINKSFNIITVILITRYIHVCIFQDISQGFSTLECSHNVRFIQGKDVASNILFYSQIKYIQSF